jgi:hypothetical protein
MTGPAARGNYFVVPGIRSMLSCQTLPPRRTAPVHCCARLSKVALANRKLPSPNTCWPSERRLKATTHGLRPAHRVTGSAASSRHRKLKGTRTKYRQYDRDQALTEIQVPRPPRRRKLFRMTWTGPHCFGA